MFYYKKLKIKLIDEFIKFRVDSKNLRVEMRTGVERRTRGWPNGQPNGQTGKPWHTTTEEYEVCVPVLAIPEHKRLRSSSEPAVWEEKLKKLKELEQARAQEEWEEAIGREWENGAEGQQWLAEQEAREWEKGLERQWLADRRREEKGEDLDEFGYGCW